MKKNNLNVQDISEEDLVKLVEEFGSSPMKHLLCGSGVYAALRKMDVQLEDTGTHILGMPVIVSKDVAPDEVFIIPPPLPQYKPRISIDRFQVPKTYYRFPMSSLSRPGDTLSPVSLFANYEIGESSVKQRGHLPAWAAYVVLAISLIALVILITLFA